MRPSRDLRKLLERRAAELAAAAGDDDGGTVVLDPVGPAIYRYGGRSSPVTIAACESCQHVALIASLPAKPAIVWKCPNGHRYRLEPPLAVLFAGMPGPRPAARA